MKMSWTFLIFLLITAITLKKVFKNNIHYWTLVESSDICFRVFNILYLSLKQKVNYAYMKSKLW